MARLFKFLLAFVFCISFLGPAIAAELTVNKIVAVVNGEMISLHELRMQSAAELARRKISPGDPKADAVQAQILDSMINDILLRQEAKRYKLTVSDAEVEAEVKKVIERNRLTPERFEEELKKQGMTRQMYAEKVRNNIIRQRITNFMILKKVIVRPEEVADYFEKHKSEFSGARTANFSLLMLPEKVNVQDVYKKVSSGAMPFEEAARQYSADASAQDGGRVSSVPWDRLPPDMQKLLATLQDGKMSPPLRTQGGFVVIRRDSVSEAKPLSLQEATPRIEEVLRAPLLEERFKAYTTQLRNKAVIDIRM